MSDTKFVKLEWDDRAFQTSVRRFMELSGDPTELMADISEHLLQSTQDRFDTEIAPDGTPWQPLRPSTLALKKGPGILKETGNLSRDGLHADFGRDFAEIAATPPYAAAHQLGTDPFVILPKAGKALRFLGGAGLPIHRRKVNHPGLPARPFMGLSDEDQAIINRKAGEAMERSLATVLRNF